MIYPLSNQYEEVSFDDLSMNAVDLICDTFPDNFEKYPEFDWKLIYSTYLKTSDIRDENSHPLDISPNTYEIKHDVIDDCYVIFRFDDKSEWQKHAVNVNQNVVDELNELFFIKAIEAYNQECDDYDA